MDGPLRDWASRLIKERGLEGSFGVYRNGKDRLNIYVYSFWSSTRITCYLDTGKVVAEDRRFRWNEFLTGMHARGGYQQEPLLQDLWALFVDLASLGMLIWVATGLYMCLKTPSQRLWGTLSLAGGGTAFVIFLAGL